MTRCELSSSSDVELYFYDELDPVSRARVQAHITGCAACQQRIEELGAIRTALAGVPRVDAPPAGDWSGFTRRLDEVVAASAPRRPSAIRAWMPIIAVAAVVELLLTGIFVAGRLRQHQPASTTIASAPPATGAAPASSTPSDRLLREQTEDHLGRSQLVVIDLATRDARHTSPADWSHERTLAASLLDDTRLFRLAAEQRGLSDVAKTMQDLETVLLEASLSDQQDPDALERVQRLIHKRDLLLKMQVTRAGI